MRRGARDDGDDERRAGEAALLLGPRRLVQVGLVRQADLERNPACAFARPSLEHHETPGRELAVIRHPRGDGQDCRELVGVGPGPVIIGGGTDRRRFRSAIVSFIGVSPLKGEAALGRNPVQV